MQSVLKVVCCPLQASLGGRVRLMATGAAPISPTVLTFLRAAIGCQVTQTSSSCVQVPVFAALMMIIIKLFLCLSSLKVTDKQSVLLDAP